MPGISVPRIAIPFKGKGGINYAAYWATLIPTLAEIKTLFGAHVIGAYPLNETSGTTAQDESGNNLDGTYKGTFALNQDGIGSDICADMLGTGGVALYSAAFVSAFNLSEGYVSFWIKANNTAFWDSSNKTFFIFGEAAGNQNCIFARTGSNVITLLIYYNSTLKSCTVPNPRGTRWVNIGFRWSVTDGTGSIYYNGVKVASVASIGTPTAYTLSADHCNLFGGWKLLTNWIDAKVQNAVVLNYAPTDADIFSSVNPIGRVVFEGDSRSSLKNWVNAAVDAARNSTTDFLWDKYSVIATAASGSGIDMLLARVATTNAYIPSKGTGVLVLWIGVNDVTLRTAEQEYAAIRQYCINARASGWNKIVICTEIDAQNNMTWHNTMWPALNALIAADHSFADAVADLGAREELQDATDVTYYNADKIHLIDAGYAVVAEVVAAALATIV